MSQSVSFSQIDLGYPPWALDFDAYNRGYLLVAGGGGEGISHGKLTLSRIVLTCVNSGQKEVPNRITLLDVSSRSSIEKAAELDITEDSPVSLGALATKEGLVAFSGINSGIADRKEGKNEHFRSFNIKYPVRSKGNKGKSAAKSTGTITALGQTTLFSPTYCSQSPDAYQRLLRLSPAKKSAAPNKRIGAIASSLAPESEIIVFKATSSSPTSADIIQRIKPIQNAEANDIDIFEQDDGTFIVAYCTQSEIYCSTISLDSKTFKPKAPLVDPVCLHSAPYPDAFAKPGRAKYRCLRFITPEHLLILSAVGAQSELKILQIHQGGGSGAIILRKRLPKSMGFCVSMDVCILDADATTGARQIVVAIAAQAQDIAVYTLDYAGTTKNTLGPFSLYKNLSVHKAAMKRVALSPFHNPRSQSDSAAAQKAAGPVFLRLGSISLSNKLCIDDLPLHQLDSSKPASRYVLSKSGKFSSTLTTASSIFALAFTMLIGLLLFQSLISQSTGTDSLNLLPQSWQDAVVSYRQRAAELSEPISRRVHEVSDPVVHSHAGQRLLDLLHLHHEDAHLPDPEKKAIVIRAPDSEDETALSTEVHPDTAELVRTDAGVKRWEELTPHQQQKWKKRMVDAGQWSADYGETILKGVFFSEVAGAVGRAAAQALAG
jgi:prolactin regulatory element-binding protein